MRQITQPYMNVNPCTVASNTIEFALYKFIDMWLSSHCKNSDRTVWYFSLVKRGKLFSEYFSRQMGHQFRCHEFQGLVNTRFNTTVQVLFPKLWTYFCHDFPLQDCSHVSKTREEFYSVRCTVADMKSLYVSLDLSCHCIDESKRFWDQTRLAQAVHKPLQAWLWF